MSKSKKDEESSENIDRLAEELDLVVRGDLSLDDAVELTVSTIQTFFRDRGEKVPDFDDEARARVRADIQSKRTDIDGMVPVHGASLAPAPAPFAIADPLTRARYGRAERDKREAERMRVGKRGGTAGRLEW